MILREAEVVYGKGRRVDCSRRIRHAGDVWAILHEYGTTTKTQEHFVVLYLNTRHNVLAVQTVHIGSLNGVDIHPREVFRGAIMAGAHSIIIAHNHPGGDPTPGTDDLKVTERLRKVGDLLGIPVLDHVIVTVDHFTSLREEADILA